jgi:ribosomal protein L44E
MDNNQNKKHTYFSTEFEMPQWKIFHYKYLENSSLSLCDFLTKKPINISLEPKSYEMSADDELKHYKELKEKYSMIKFMEFGESVNTLLCPYCDHFYTHHINIEVYQRTKEDSLEGRCLQIDDLESGLGNIKVYNNINNNPSSRRYGIRIYIYCEECLKIFILNIYQHKGQTLFEIEKTNKINEPEMRQRKKYEEIRVYKYE